MSEKDEPKLYTTDDLRRMLRSSRRSTLAFVPANEKPVQRARRLVREGLSLIAIVKATGLHERAVGAIFRDEKRRERRRQLKRKFKPYRQINTIVVHEEP